MWFFNQGGSTWEIQCHKPQSKLLSNKILLSKTPWNSSEKIKQKIALITFYLFNILQTLFIIIFLCIEKNWNFIFFYISTIIIAFYRLLLMLLLLFCAFVCKLFKQQQFSLLCFIISCIVAYRTPGVVQFMLKQTLLVSIATNGF